MTTRPPRTTLLMAGWRRGLGSWALLWSARLALAWTVSRPLAVALSAGGDADRALFEPGGLMLLELLRLRLDPLLEALGTSALLVVGAWVLLVVVTTSSVALLDQEPHDRVSAAWSATACALPRVLLLAALAGVAAAFACLFVVLGVTGVVARLQLSPVAAELVAVSGVAVGLTLLALGGLGFDLVRVQLVRRAPNLRVALREAARAFRAHVGRLLLGRVAVFVVSLLMVAGVAWAVRRLDLTREATGPLLAMFVLHRFGGAALAAIQVTWLALVVQASGPRPPAKAPYP